MKNKSALGRHLIDTNIFIYSFDDSDPLKKNRAQLIIAEAISSGQGLISYQVIQEFVSVALSKFNKIFDYPKLVLYLDEILFVLWKAYPERESYLKALDVKHKYNLSWWDSLLVSSAISMGCRSIITEDLQHDSVIENVQIINPFESKSKRA